MEGTVIAETSSRSGGDRAMRGGDASRRRPGGGLHSWLLQPEFIYRSSLDEVGGMVKDLAGAWTAFNIALSALFYLLDFATNLLTLHTYYFSINDNIPSECNVIMGMGRTLFYVCLSLMAAAHLFNTFIFWVTLDASEHPFRLAYFLPLIHLSRLLKLLWRTCSCNSLADLQDRGQKESSSLYNVLAAALEAAPQLMLQFHVATQFGIRRVPKTMILSLVASLISGTYNGSVAVLRLLQKRPGIILQPLRWKACLVMLAGLHILTAMSTQALITASLAVYMFLVITYVFTLLIIMWIFFAFGLPKSQHHSLHSQNMYNRRNHKWMIHGVHSLALAFVSLFIGPMYVIVKVFDRPACFLVWGTLLHIFVELLGLGAVLGSLGKNRPWPAQYFETACYLWSDNLANLASDVFLEAVCPLIFGFLVSTLVFANMVAKTETNSCESDLQLGGAAKDEQQLAVLDAVSIQLMETLVAPAEYMSMPNNSVDPETFIAPAQYNMSMPNNSVDPETFIAPAEYMSMPNNSVDLETFIAPAEYMSMPNNSGDPEVGRIPHHIHSFITTTSCDASPLALLPRARSRPSSSFVSIFFVALFIKRLVLRRSN